MADKKIPDLDPQNDYIEDGELAVNPSGDPEAKRITLDVVAPKITSSSVQDKTTFDRANDVQRVSSSGGDEERVTVSEYMRQYVWGDVYETDVYSNAGSTRYGNLKLQKIGRSVTAYFLFENGLVDQLSTQTGRLAGGAIIEIPDEFAPSEEVGLDNGIQFMTEGIDASEKNPVAIAWSGSFWQIEFRYENFGVYLSRNLGTSYISANSDVYLNP